RAGWVAPSDPGGPAPSGPGAVRALTGRRRRPMLGPGSRIRAYRSRRADAHRVTHLASEEDNMRRGTTRLVLAILALGWLIGGGGPAVAAEKVVVAITSPQSGPQ